MNTIQIVKITRVLVMVMALAGVVRADEAPASPSARPPVPFTAEGVTPIVRSTLWSAIGWPVAGGVAGGAIGFFASKMALRSLATQAAKRWIPTILARGTGTVLGAVGAALLVNYLFDRSREARVRQVNATHSTPPESHPERVTDSLPREPGETGDPGFEDVNVTADFPK